jgi:hypothetical protein
MAGEPYKRFRSTFTTHHGAPAWIIEEVKPEEPLYKPEEPQLGKLKIENHMGDELDHWLNALAEADIPGMTLQWNDDEGWYFHFPEEPKPIPEKITVGVEQDNDGDAVMPPVKYFDADGQPVYYFEDPLTGHKYWDECECEACFADCLLNNDGMTPQELRDQAKWMDQQEALKKAKEDEEESTAESMFPEGLSF